MRCKFDRRVEDDERRPPNFGGGSPLSKALQYLEIARLILLPFNENVWRESDVREK